MFKGIMVRSVRNAAALFFMVALSSVGSLAQGAEYANPWLMATVTTLTENVGKPDWVIIDCRDEKAYAAGHIPGAISLGSACGKVLRDATHREKKTKDLEELLGNSGVSMEKHVVVYADAKLITSASVAFWIFEHLGHDKVHFLNGGVEAWQEAGKPLETRENRLSPVSFKARVVKSRLSATDEMAGIGKGETKGVNVIDSRTENEHSGSDIRALRGGHIPNTTLNVSHVKTYDVQTGTIHSMDDLESIFGALDKNRRTIAYCQTGTRSTLIYLEMRLMGFTEPANYDDSWIIYGSNVDYPVADENWYDFVRMNDTVKTVDELKKAVEELRKK